MISQLIEDDTIPEYDNLYLDMNSILHTCTHSDNDTLTRMTDDQMYAAIFNYIDHLFDIIKPKEVFYMAIDGVAPRAKMNQQRSRRFRTAYEAEENLRKAISQGEVIPKEDPFDSNAITPGTEFMAKLTNNLKYFIHKKITEDNRWANIKVILSGHEVPGEGEHKIMQFIRSMKSQDDYNPNLRHCIYGLDADLIMLGLVTHDPHFSLLREEVVFGPSSRNKSGDIHEQNFYLLHLSLLREYMGLEFQDLEGELPFEYSFERVLDDFILIMYVIGNDFLPNLPDLHINKGAFPFLIGAFKESLKHMDGYLNEGGKINFKRFGTWLEYLSEFELENFEKQNVDAEWFNKRLELISISGEKKRERSGKLLMLKDEKKLVSILKPWLLETGVLPISQLTDLANKDALPTCSLPSDLAKAHMEFLKTFALETGILIVHSRSNDTYEATIDVDGISPYETEDEFNERVVNLRKTIKNYQSSNLVATEETMKEAKDLYDEKFVRAKDEYYKKKLHFSIHDEEKMIEFTRHYLEGLQWVLYYYYKGCASWNWYFRYHYAPRISDVAMGVKDMLEKNQDEIHFDLATPFKPFEQLMAVLPARSRKLMPDVYRSLMTDEHSPIIDFYPHEVEIDLNGKTASWEAVVLLSFVDEKRLLEALKPIEAKLTPAETKRNSYGQDVIFIRNPQNDNVYPTPLPGYFQDLEHDQCYEEFFTLPPVDANFKFELPEGAKLGKEALAGFPTLYTVPFESKLALAEVKIFNFPSKSESMLLKVGNMWEDISINQFAYKFLGKVVYSKWPNLIESRVTQVWGLESKFEYVKSGAGRRVVATPLSPEENREFLAIKGNLKLKYEKTKGVILKKIEAVVFVQHVKGLVRTQKGAYVKSFHDEADVFPMQLIVENVVNEDERYASRPPVPIEEEFPIGLPVVFLGAFAYGAPAIVMGYTGDKLNVLIQKIQSALEPDIGRKRYNIENKEIPYVASYDAAKILGINGLLLSKITGSFMLRDRGMSKVNIGLDLKFDVRRLKVLGYTRKNGKFWEYSPLAIDLIKEYKSKFPKVFAQLSKLGSRRDMPSTSEIGSPEELKQIVQWLKKAKSGLVQVSLESSSLTKFSIAAIETYMDNYITRPLTLDLKDVKAVPKDAVINPSTSYSLLQNQRFTLGDRIIYVQDSGKVPKLSKGTVVAITTVGSKTSLSVVFDHPLVTGNNMNGKLKSNRGLIIDSSLVLNITNRQLVYHSNASKGKKTLSDAERAALLSKKQAADRAVKEENHKTTNELLALLNKSADQRGDKGSDKGSENGVDKSAPKSNVEKEKESQSVTDDVRTNPTTIKQIYGQIYSNIMNQGVVMPGMVEVPPYAASQGMQMPHGPVPQGIPVPQGMPMPGMPVPQGMPVPPAGFPQPIFKQAPNQVLNGSETVSEDTPSNDRTSGNSRGGRGGSRGNRGSYSGRGRGRGRGRGGKPQN